MNESFANLEEMIREVARDVSPAVSLRQRILAASHNARVRQLRRVQTQRAAGYFLASLCLVCVSMFAQWSLLQTLGRPNDYEHSLARSHAFEDSRDLMSDTATALVSQTEESTVQFGDPIEWETARSFSRRRDRQSALISRYF